MLHRPRAGVPPGQPRKGQGGEGARRSGLPAPSRPGRGTGQLYCASPGRLHTAPAALPSAQVMLGPGEPPVPAEAGGPQPLTLLGCGERSASGGSPPRTADRQGGEQRGPGGVMALAATRPPAGPTLLVRSISGSPLSASPSSPSKAERRGQAAAATRGRPPGEPGSGANIQAGTGDPPGTGDLLRSAAAIFPSLPGSPPRHRPRARQGGARQSPAAQRPYLHVAMAAAGGVMVIHERPRPLEKSEANGRSTASSACFLHIHTHNRARSTCPGPAVQ